jgi:hypothetical protein
LAHADFSRFVENYVDALERLIYKLSIANITLDEFGGWIQIGRNSTLTVNLRDKPVEYANTMPSIHKSIHEVRANKTGATSH